MRPFVQNLAKLKNVSFVVAAGNTPDEEGTAAIVIEFSEGTRLTAFYWRLIRNGRAELSSFDHQKKYGLPAPIDAKEQIASLLAGKICSNLQFNSETGDLTLVLGETANLQVFNFTGYEIWTLQFPDGTGEYSNYALCE